MSIASNQLIYSSAQVRAEVTCSSAVFDWSTGLFVVSVRHVALAFPVFTGNRIAYMGASFSVALNGCRS